MGAPFTNTGRLENLEVLSVALVAGPAFSFSFRSNPGTTYTIQRSENLLSWASVGTITATGTTTTYTSAPLVPGEPRFSYRAAK